MSFFVISVLPYVVIIHYNFFTYILHNLPHFRCHSTFFRKNGERTDCDPAAWHSIWQEDRDKGFSGTVSVPDRNIYHNVSDRTGTVWNRSSFTGNASAVDFLFTGVHRV